MKKSGTGILQKMETPQKPQRVCFHVPDDLLDQVTRQFSQANCTHEAQDAAEIAVVFMGHGPQIERDFARQPIILLRLHDHDNDAVSAELAKLNADGILTLPLRPQDIHAQILLAKQTRRLKQIQQRKIENLEMNLRQRRSIEKAIEMISAERGINRMQAYEFMRKAAMNERLPVWGWAERRVKEDTGAER